jgi:hypothetical protein
LSVRLNEQPSASGLAENEIFTRNNRSQFEYARFGGIHIEAHAEPFDGAIGFGSEEIERG